MSLDNVFFIVSFLSRCVRLSCLPFQCASFIRNKQVYNFRLAWLVEALRYKPDGRGFDSPMVSMEILIDIILLAALWPWG